MQRLVSHLLLLAICWPVLYACTWLPFASSLGAVSGNKNHSSNVRESVERVRYGNHQLVMIRPFPFIVPSNYKGS